MSRFSERLYGGIEKFWSKNRAIIAITALVGLFLLIYFWNAIAISIYSGQQGVLWSRFDGTVISTAYDEGFHLILPWNDMTIYQMRVQEHADSITALTVDGMALDIHFSLIYRPLRSELGFIHRTIGPGYFQSLIHPVAVSSIRQVIGTLRSETLIAMPEDSLLESIQHSIHSGRFRYQLESQEQGRILVSESDNRLPRDFDPETEQILVEDLINLFQVNVKIHRLSLPPKVQEAINEKLVHEQMEESYVFRLSREEKERERKIIEAQGIAEFWRISNINPLKWRGIEATEELAKSPNAKLVVIGTDESELPILLNGGETTTAAAPPPATSSTPSSTPTTNSGASTNANSTATPTSPSSP